MALKIEGALAANISCSFGIPVTAKYHWADQDRVINLTGVVGGPIRSSRADPKEISNETPMVRLTTVKRTETIDGVPEVFRDDYDWSVETGSVTLTVGNE